MGPHRWSAAWLPLISIINSLPSEDGQNDTLPFEQPEEAVGLAPGWNRNDPLRTWSP